MSWYNNYTNSHFKNSHFVALAGAIVLHVGIAAWAMASSQPIAMRPQKIMISIASSSEVLKTEEQQLKLEQKPQLDGWRKVKKSEEKKKQNQHARSNAVKKNISKTELTPRSKDVESTANTDVRSEPIFDAVYLNNPRPIYPSAARDGGVQGKVLLEVNVTKQGVAGEIVVSSSSGFEVLDDAALSAVRQWRFIPAKKGAEIVEAKVVVPVEFKLN